MKLQRLLCLLAALAAASAGCRDDPGPSSSTARECPPPASGANASPSLVDCGAHDALARLDPRRPVPLQPMMAWHQKQNMQAHLEAIQGIVGGLVRADWEEVARASALIESSPQMKQMCRHMGAGAAGFTEQALDFHRRADAIGAAARARDAQAVLEATETTLEACTGCHAAYRQEVVDAATWEARVGIAHDPSSSGH